MLLVDALVSVVLGVTGPNRRAARVNARGTLGGLGLPGGARPWLAPIGSPPARAKGLVRRALPDVRLSMRVLSRRVRRRWFIARLHVAAWLVRSRVDVDIDKTADLPRDVTFEVRPRCRPRVRMASGVHVQPGLTLRLAGDLDVGPRSQLRYGLSINVKGRLRFTARNMTGRGSTIHADGDMVWGWGAMVGEHVSVIDSDHAVDGSMVHPFDLPVVQRDISMGAASFVGAHSTVTAGVTIGAGTAVGANSVVSRSLPAGVLAVGSPATPIRSLPSSWAGPHG
jgi:acetyltransferase-like isoleucine patch superfamily enzyme